MIHLWNMFYNWWGAYILGLVIGAVVFTTDWGFLPTVILCFLAGVAFSVVTGLLEYVVQKKQGRVLTRREDGTYQYTNRGGKNG